MARSPPKVIFLVSDYGHDPTETAIPYRVFHQAGFGIFFATETGNVPECDRLMLNGWTQKLLGAAAPAVEAYHELSGSEAWQHPLAWTNKSVRLEDFDLVFLPGGHDKGVRQVLDSRRVSELVSEYLPLTKRPGGKKVCAAICHGVQVLAHSKDASGRSLLHNLATTALPAAFENTADYGTRLLLGDYYKTYGAGTDNVEAVVKNSLADPGRQWRCSVNPASPFVVEDEGYNYLSARWPGDAELLAEKTVELVRKAMMT